MDIDAPLLPFTQDQPEDLTNDDDSLRSTGDKTVHYDLTMSSQGNSQVEGGERKGTTSATHVANATPFASKKRRRDSESNEEDDVALADTSTMLSSDGVTPCSICKKQVPNFMQATHFDKCFAKEQLKYADKEQTTTQVETSSASTTAAHPNPSPRKMTAASRRTTLVSSGSIFSETPAAASSLLQVPAAAAASSSSSSSKARPSPQTIDDEDEEMKEAPPLVQAKISRPSTVVASSSTSPPRTFDSVPRFNPSASSAAASSSTRRPQAQKSQQQQPLIEQCQAEFLSALNGLRQMIERSYCDCSVVASPFEGGEIDPEDDFPTEAAAAASSSPRRRFTASLSSGLRALESAYRSSLASYASHVSSLRSQLDSQAEEFVSVRLQLEQHVQGTQKKQDEELSRIRIEEMIAREEEARRLRDEQVKKEGEWLTERLKVEEQSSATIADLKKQAESVAAKLEMLSSNNSAALMEGEAKAIETGEGDLKRIIIHPSEHFSGQTNEEFHFRLAESQFLRMVGGGGGMAGAYHVTCVEYIMNPPLLKRYHDFKKALKEKGEPVAERLTFHGTSVAAIQKIVVEGFRVGGVDTPVAAGTALGTGVYSSESPAFAMGYIKDGRSCLLFTRVCPTRDSVIQKVGNVIQQLVCKHREQIIPAYIVHYASGARGSMTKGKKGFGGAFASVMGAIGLGGSFAAASSPIKLSTAPIILAGAPSSAAAGGYSRGRRIARPAKKARRIVPAPVAPPSGSDNDDDEDDPDYAAAIAASLA